MNKQDKPLKVTIKTFGCQMNVYDTEVASGILKHQGYEIAHEHEDEESSVIANEVKQSQIASSLEAPRNDRQKKKDWRRIDSDIVLMNTCSVREHAEERVQSRMGMLKKAKETNPDLIIGLMGCMVEEHREKLFKKYPHLDLMVGTRNLKELPDLIKTVRERRTQVSSIKQDGISIEYTDQIQRTGKYHAWLPIMTGCNKVCTFCIVPITRGSEVSMKARDVYREASRLVEEGVQWITLLGQNVNSYNGAEVTVGSKQEAVSSLQNEVAVPTADSFLPTGFPALLDMLCEIKGLERISFTTSHPHDATEELFQVIKKNSKISRRFHLPLQSGSNNMLKRMKRLHTFDEYKEKLARLKSLVPDISLTTDIIAGFSGETDQDHEETMKALEAIRYDGAYIYKYSLRPGTPAAKLPDDVPQEIKEKRNAELLTLQRKITVECNQSWVGKTTHVFLESQSSRHPGFLIGRSDNEKRVTVKAPPDKIGSFVQVHLDSLHHETFTASLLL